MKHLFILIITICSVNAYGQHALGKVVSTNDSPIEGAYVYNLNSKTHTHTNNLGEFEIHQTKIGDSITIGILGFKKSNFIIENKSGAIYTLIEKVFELDEMIISQEINPLKAISKIDLMVNPVNSSQEFLRKVPGLFISQHAGGGKAEQLFLRGFDIDHGTDVAIDVDGIPVNMVSHAHGQGYSDLHFLIPETIDNIDYGKGPHYGNKGDFNTAGYVSFNTKDKVKNNLVSVNSWSI